MLEELRRIDLIKNKNKNHSFFGVFSLILFCQTFSKTFFIDCFFWFQDDLWSCCCVEFFGIYDTFYQPLLDQSLPLDQPFEPDEPLDHPDSIDRKKNTFWLLDD